MDVALARVVHVKSRAPLVDDDAVRRLELPVEEREGAVARRNSVDALKVELARRHRAVGAGQGEEGVREDEVAAGGADDVVRRVGGLAVVVGCQLFGAAVRVGARDAVVVLAGGPAGPAGGWGGAGGGAG